MKSTALALAAGLSLTVLAVPGLHAATVTPTLTGFDVVITAGDLGASISIPDSSDPLVPLVVGSPGVDLKIINDSGVTLDSLSFVFSFPPIIAPPLALAVSSPDFPSDLSVPGVPSPSAGVFDLGASGPGTYVATIAPSGGIPDDADTTPDATLIFLYSPDAGSPATVDFAVRMSPIPEPGSAFLALLGLAGLVARRRR